MDDVRERQELVERWLGASAADGTPCGPNLEYAGTFLALEQAVAGKPETQHSAAEPPDWSDVYARASALMDETRDLRVVVPWIRAAVRLHGAAALLDGLQLLNGLVSNHWEALHPEPDDGDHFARVNALNALASPEYLLGDLRASPVYADRRVGELLGRTFELAWGGLTPRDDESPPSRDSLALMLQEAYEQSPQLAELPARLRAELGTLTSALDDRLAGTPGLDLAPLSKWLYQLGQLFPATEAAAEGEPAEGEAPAEAAPGGGGRAVARTPGAIQSRADAIQAIDAICRYLDQHEPTNPAQLLLRRAKSLIGHNFLQLMKELAPDALAEVARVMGVDPETVTTQDS